MGMGKAGAALRYILRKYGISQNRLATTIGVNRSSVNNWYNENRDPSAEALSNIIKALRVIKAEASEEFLQLYLEHLTIDADDSEEV